MNLFAKRKNPLLMMQQEPPQDVGPTLEQLTAPQNPYQQLMKKIQPPPHQQYDMSGLDRLIKEANSKTPPTENPGVAFGRQVGDIQPAIERGAQTPAPTLEDAGGLLWRAGVAGASPAGAGILVTKKLYDMFNKPSEPQFEPQPWLKDLRGDNDEEFYQSIKDLPADQKQAAINKYFGMAQEDLRANPMMGGGNVPEGVPDTGEGGSPLASLLSGAKDIGRNVRGAGQDLKADSDRLAFEREFERTPELDRLISGARNELDMARLSRKQPGLGEFLTMALMNLGGMNPRNSADMVLGLGEQREREGRLEDRLAQLEGGRASAKMGGRRDLRATQQRDRYSALERMMQQQEASRKQGNADREFGFKSQKMGFDKLMQAIGQMRQQKGTEIDANEKKALQEQIDRLDPYNPKNQKKPQDNRQSRMFGDAVGGAGYA